MCVECQSAGSNKWDGDLKGDDLKGDVMDVLDLTQE
jgi:hypothetical protein